MASMTKLKVGILTFHRAYNYGALLQSFALQQVLLQMGTDVEFLNYRCPAIENFYVYGLFPHFSRNPRRWIFQLAEHRAKKLQQKKCEEFRNHYLRMSRDYDDNNRGDVIGQYDLLITGSDQIWNPSLTRGKSDWYAFLRQTDSQTIVSYAASVGSLYSFRYYFRFYEQNLAAYDRISVREENVKKYLETHLNRSVDLVVDPTLLVQKDIWFDLMSASSMENEPYLLYYDVETNDEARKIACRLSREKNLKLVHFNRELIFRESSHYAQNQGPCEFLSLIAHAEAVVTSSFHATVFSVLFEKQFIVVPHSKTGDRVRELLKKTGLESRFVEKDNVRVSALCDTEIDYVKALKKLDNLRDASMAYLEECVQLAEEKAYPQNRKNR